MRRLKLLLLLLALPIGMLAQKTEASRGLRQTEAKPLAKTLTRAEGKEGIIATLKYDQLPDMNKARVGHQIFPSGKGFVVAGGVTENTQLASSAEIYENGQWKEIPMGDGHYSGYSVELNDGRVMVGGGYNVNDTRNHLKKTEIYNPATKSFSAGPDMTLGRIQSRAIAIGKNVYVSGNYFSADNTLEYYDGTKFSAIGEMDGRSNPYLFSDNQGNVYSLSTLNENGSDFGFYTDQDGNRCLRGDMYDVAEGKTYYYNYYFYAQWVPLPLPSDAHVTDYHYKEDGVNYYVILTQNNGQYLLTEICPDNGKTYTYKSFNIPLAHPVTNEKLYYRNGVFVNSTKREFYLIALSASSNETTVKLHIISFNYGNGNWTIASAPGFTYNLLNASWTMLSDGRLACTGGYMYNQYDAQKYAYIFSPATAGTDGMEETPPSMGGSRLVVWLKSGEKVGYELSDQPITTFSGSKLVIQTNKVTIPYERRDVLRYTYEYIEATGIDLLPGERRVVINREGDEIIFRGLQAGSIASVYAVNGRLVEQLKASDYLPLTISLKNRPNGVYIVKAGTETIKVMKR